MHKKLDKIPAQKASPILLHLSKSGIEISALILRSGLAKDRVMSLLKNAETPDPFECYLLDQALRCSLGTMLEEYTIWDYGAYQIA